MQIKGFSSKVRTPYRRLLRDPGTWLISLTTWFLSGGVLTTLTEREKYRDSGGNLNSCLIPF